MRTILIPLLAVLFVPAVALAEVESAFPDCAALGDKLIIRGSDFAEEPAVQVGGADAEVLKSRDDTILVRIPTDAATGLADVTVDGETLTEAVTLLEEGAPTILKQSAETGTVGQHLLLIGRRLDGGEADFLDGDGNVQATATLKGRRLAAFLTVPELDPGTYTIRVTNEDGLDTGACSPTIEIVEAGEPTLDSVEPAEALPGARIELIGTNLGPGGFVLVLWTRGDETRKRPGFSNGFDTIFTHVPFGAEPGATYDVTVVLGHDDEDDTAGPLEYTLGNLPPPVIDELSEEIAPAGSTFRITGTNLFNFSDKPEVCLTDGDTVVEAKVIFGVPGWKFFDDVLVVRVPSDTADADYDVTVKLGDEVSNAVTITVGPRPLAVDSMKPDSQGPNGPRDPVFIKGSGFTNSEDIAVVWEQEGEEPLEGKILFRTDDLLVVVPPGGRSDPLAEGEYEVSVVLDPGAVDEESVLAGTYTVDS